MISLEVAQYLLQSELLDPPCQHLRLPISVLYLGALGTLTDLANACLGLIAALVAEAVPRTQRGSVNTF